LGQNFLTDPNIARKITSGAALTKKDTVIEIGPGLGALTETLAERAGRVIAVEVDRGLFRFLTDNLGSVRNLKIVCGDILKFEIRELTGSNRGKVKIVGNLPYSITTPVIVHLLNQRERIDSILVTVQKEVAERLLAKPAARERGAISCLVQFYMKVVAVGRIKASCFYPRPKVDSTILKLKVLEKPVPEVDDEKIFFEIIRASFAKRRKTILNALSGSNLRNLNKEDLSRALGRAKIDSCRRGETFSLKEFADVCEEITKAQSGKGTKAQSFKAKS